MQEKARAAYQIAALLKLASVKPKDTDNEYFLQCYKCGVDVCSSFDIR